MFSSNSKYYISAYLVYGTKVNCLDPFTLESSSLAVVNNIISGHPIHGTHDWSICNDVIYG